MTACMVCATINILLRFVIMRALCVCSQARSLHTCVCLSVCVLMAYIYAACYIVQLELLFIYISFVLVWICRWCQTF
jgi:hypothetical protein